MKTKKQEKIKSFPLISKYKMTSIMIAKWFNYKNGNSLRNSSAYLDILQGIESILKEVESKSPQES
jgi:hypothetical protein